jgi:predicted phosphodiesterase
MRDSWLVKIPGLVAIIAFALQGATPEKIVGGPYTVNVGPRSATVMWLVQTGEVSLGTSPDKTDKKEPILRAERVQYNGLTAGTTYYYDSFGGEAGKGSFKTAPTGAAKFEFVVYGDTRTRHDVHRKVIEGVLKYANPDFVVQSGDLVENGNDNALWPIFFEAERELLRRAAYFPSLGNHDRSSKNYFDFMSAVPYYSFDWGTAHFSVINTDINNVGRTEAERQAFWMEQTRWLEADLLANQKADQRFVVGHHPPMTAVKSRQGDNPHVTALELLLQKYKVTVAFFGHDHNYQHYLKNGIHYIVTGGGGAPLYDVDVPPVGVTQKVEKTENFVVVRVNGKSLHMEAKRPDGSVIDITDVEPK